MKHLPIGLLLIILVIFASIGCSRDSSNPVMTSELYDEETELSQEGESSRVFLGLYDLNFDSSTESVEMVQARDANFHINVTNYLFPPNCVDCVKYKIIAYHRLSKTLGVEITVKNPTSLAAFDVRGIVYTSGTNLNPLANADAWTNLYDVPGGNTMNINPFIAFGKGTSNRRLAGGASLTAYFKFYFPGPWSVRLGFDASYPTNCAEPYEIKYFFLKDPIIDDWDDYAIAEVTILDWQNDIPADGVRLWVPALWTSYSFLFWKTTEPNIWNADITNNTDAEPGNYEGLLVVTTPGGNLYKYVTVPVGHSAEPVGISKLCEYPLDGGLGIGDIAFDGNNVYAVHEYDYENYFIRVDKVSPQSCEGLDRSYVSDWPYPFAINKTAALCSDDYLYILSSNYGASHLHILDKETMGRLSKLDFGDNTMHWDMVLDGETLWFAGIIHPTGMLGHIQAVSVKDPYNPSIIYTDGWSENAMAIDVQNEWIYIAGKDPTSNHPYMKMFNKETLRWGAMITCNDGDGFFIDIDAIGDYVYMPLYGYLGAGPGIITVDLTTDYPEIVNFFNAPDNVKYYTSMSVVGTNLFVCRSYVDQIDMFRISEPGNEKYLTSYEHTGGENQYIKAIGDTLVAENTYGDNSILSLRVIWN